MAKTAAQLDAEIAVFGKWQRDGIDRYETWWLGREEDPIASVHPTWGPTRGTGIGKPDYWEVVVGNKRARAETPAEGKKRALVMLKEGRSS